MPLPIPTHLSRPAPAVVLARARRPTRPLAAAVLALCCAAGLIGFTLPSATFALPPGPIPQWIWTSRDCALGSPVELHRTFELRAAPRHASAWLLADDRATLLVNGHEVATAEGTRRIRPVEITRWLRPGTNQLVCRAVNEAGAAGVAVWLALDSDTGSRDVLVSDPQWSTREAEHQVEPVRSLGLLGNLPWGNPEGESEDYYQWKKALGQTSAHAATQVAVLTGFEVELVRSSAPGEGSWVSLAFDHRGRIILGREGKGLLRYSLPPVDSLEVINDTLEECRGVLVAGRSLFANANNSRGLYRLRDTDDDDRYDEQTLLRQTAGGVGHGRNALALGPDGMVYAIHGNNVRVNPDDLSPLSPLRNFAEDALHPCDWDRFLFDADAKVPAGHVVRIDPNGGRWELVAGGFRNPYGLDFNAEGELFTFDADNEGDLGTPWYRPNRVHHVLPGGDYGFRQGTANRDRGFPEHLPAVVDLGLASPTGVKFGTRSDFPPRYRRALYVLDWSYGRIYAVHLLPQGAGYVATVEKLVEGSPLNVTDLAFGPDGALYFLTGGRGTQSGLYRVRATAPHSPGLLVANPADDQPDDLAPETARRVRRQLESWQTRTGSVGLELAWGWLGSRQPTLQHAARVALEFQPVEQWLPRVFEAEVTGERGAAAALALARVGPATVRDRLLQHLAEPAFTPDRWSQLSTTRRLAVLRGVTVCLARMGRPDAGVVDSWAHRLEPLFLAQPGERWSPETALVEQWLLELLVYCDAPPAVARGLAWAETLESPAERLRVLFVLRNAVRGWTPGLRRQAFELLRGLDQHPGGNLLPVALDALRNEMLGKSPEGERGELERLFAEGDDAFGESQRELASRPVVKRWERADLDAILATGHTPNVAAGARLFERALCVRCHRREGRGGVVGPELSGVANRFGPRDLLAMIVEPSASIDEKYQQTQVETRGGKVLVGRVVGGDDKQVLLASDPFRPRQTTRIAREEIVGQEKSATSPMPSGLLDTLRPEEILDLLAYLRTNVRGAGRAE
ncbi:MAG: c-type cytochrome [Planctomycetaceae bacterium]